ncbi:interaptin-like isoform X2 [Hylaeus anthracinus]|uniref:interaptin-like isoform X2 n=1 Tax=Hylaeus anthracinus TaxID=313031 RepID=UPI0023B9A2BC|nr:interaptin-like isoform X2 [Hylaeus anthracinus]
MNNLDSMIEPVPNISTVVDEDRDFIASDKSTQELCDKTECLKLIDEFHKLYEDRIKLVDRVCFTELDRVSMKLEISKEWIKNLREQNISLVQTVEELEETVCSKAKILEQQLKQTSVLASKKKTESIFTEKTINELSSRVSNLEKHEEYMQQKVEFLQSDIRSLLEFIRRAAQEKRWNLDGITFFEIQPSDIPVPIDCSCDQEETNHESIQTLKLQIERFQENEKKMIAYQTELENKVTRINEKLEIKEDTIKKHCTQFQNLSDNLKKRAKFTNQVSCNSVDETRAVENVFVGTNTCQENEVISYLTKVKSWMEQEKEDLLKLKADLENTLNKLYFEKDQECCETMNEFDENSLYELTKNIDCVKKMCSKKEELIANINSSILCTDVNQQFKLMDIFRACAIEAQVTTEDLKEEIGIIVSTFKSRHQKYTDLNKEIMNVQNQLIRSRERTMEAINKLELKEEESKRHNERINSGNIKLKDIKDKMNHAQSKMSVHITEMQSNLEEKVFSNYTEMCMCNDLLHSAIEEIEQSSNSLQVFQGCCIATDVEELKSQLCEMDLSIKKLQQRIHDALLEHDVVESTLSQKEKKLVKLEKEVDAIHSKIQHILDKFIFSKDQVCDSNVAESQQYTQTLNEILQIKQDLHRLRKEHDELKCKLVQKSRYTECDENTCLWKCRMTDLQDQIKIMQHEAKCNQETNNFLKKNIESIEEELRIVQAKAHKFKRSYSIDNIELQKKLIKLENALKLQEEIECSLRQQLNDNEVELKKSKEVLNSFYAENNVEETLLHCGCNQFKHDAMVVPQLLKTLQDTMKSTKCGLQELKKEFKKLICEDQSNLCSSARSVMNLMDKLQKYEDELDHCSQETEKLKHILSKKDKLLEDMNKIIKIQKDSIFMTQAELKELHQNLQKKIDNKDQVISNNEKEKQELLKQNQLQIQTIWHLQNAVVEAKRCIDQMGHGTMSDLQEKCKIIRLLTVYAEETQSQYNECFAEAAKQDKLLELQREVICHLQQRMSYLEYDNYSTITSIHDMHYSILRIIKEQLEAHVNDIQTLKYKIDTLIQLKCCSENKFKNMKKLWQETEGKLQELKNSAFKSQQTTKTYEDKECQCKVEVVDNDCVTEDRVNFNELTCNNTKQCKDFLREHELQSEIDTLSRENDDMKKQLQKCKLDFDIIDKELKLERENGTYTQQVSFELKKKRDTECCLRYENEQLRSDLKKQAKKIEKLQLVKENNVKFEKLVKKLEDKQMQINSLCNQVTNNEIVMKKQVETIEELEKKLDIKNEEIKEYLSELNDAEEEMSSLHDRIQSLKNLLTRKSNEMSKLQADYEVLKNDNSILRMENNAFENKSKEEYGQLKNMLKDVQMQLCYAENNYHRVTEDFNKTQEQLIEMTKREADLQECLTNTEKEYCSKLLNIEKEKIKLADCLDRLRDELEEIEKEQEKNKKIEMSKCCIVQQLQECMEQNCILSKEKAMVEQNNCDIISELQETHKSLLELRKECHLKNKSLACISAELTETAISRSELCNQSQYVVSCIRVWMEEQREYVKSLNSKLKSYQQQLLKLGFEKKALLDETRKLKRINHLLTQRLKRIHKHGGKNIKNLCVGCHMVPSIVAQNTDVLFPVNTKYSSSQKKLRISTRGNAWWFPKMKYLINELRKNNLEYKENFSDEGNTSRTLEENRDCGYQSSTSK